MSSFRNIRLSRNRSRVFVCTYGDDLEYDENNASQKMTWEERRALAFPVNDFLYKRVLRRGKKGRSLADNGQKVKVRISNYWKSDARDVRNVHLNKTFVIGEDDTMRGLNKAVLTMLPMEVSEFLVELVLEATGRIFHAYFTIELFGIDCPNGDPGRAFRSFNQMCREALMLRTQVKTCVSRVILREAVHSLRRVVALMSGQLVHTPRDIRRQRMILISLFECIMMAKNKLGEWGATCHAMKAVRRLTANAPSFCALYNCGIALHSLGQYVAARDCLLQARREKPHHIGVNAKLLEVTWKVAQEQGVEQVVTISDRALAEMRRAYAGMPVERSNPDENPRRSAGDGDQNQEKKD